METETTQRMSAPSSAGLADGVHDLAQQVLVGEVLRLLRIAGALDDLAPETLDLVRGHGGKLLSSASPDSSCSLSMSRVRGRGSGSPCSSLKLRKQRQAALVEAGGTVLLLAVEPGDEVVDQLGVAVLLQTTMKQGGTATFLLSCQRSKVFS
jgi:hypothetical protein